MERNTFLFGKLLKWAQVGRAPGTLLVPLAQIVSRIEIANAAKHGGCFIDTSFCCRTAELKLTYRRMTTTRRLPRPTHAPRMEPWAATIIFGLPAHLNPL